MTPFNTTYGYGKEMHTAGCMLTTGHQKETRLFSSESPKQFTETEINIIETIFKHYIDRGFDLCI